MHSLGQISAITVLFGVIYWCLSSLPNSECGWLHYQPPEVSADGIEFCGEDSPTFIDLEALPYPVQLNIAATAPLISGREALCTIQLELQSGKIIYPHELALSHTRKLHLMVVGPGGKDYHHIHPEPLGPSGQWQFSFAPKMTGEYKVFADFVLHRTRQRILAASAVAVQKNDRLDELDGNIKRSDTVAPVVTLHISPAQPSVGVENTLQLQFSYSDASVAVKLEPVMGALAHMVAFDEQLHGFAHLHPKYTGNEDQDRPKLDFAFNTAKAGNYRLWAQFKINGEEFFHPFDLKVL